MQWTMTIVLMAGLGLGAATEGEKKEADGGTKAACDEAVCAGQEAPAFMLKTAGGIYHRSSEHAGRRVLLVFFRTDCKPCLKVMEAVARFHRAWRERVDVVAVALLEREDGRARLDEYLEQSRFSFPVLVDADERVAADYIIHEDVITLPALFFIDTRGIITHRLHRLTRPLASYVEE